MLEDYLAWTPERGSNPAIELMEQALAHRPETDTSFGFAYCCFASAWRRPDDREWSQWIDSLPDSARSAIPLFASRVWLPTCGARTTFGRWRRSREGSAGA